MIPADRKAIDSLKQWLLSASTKCDNSRYLFLTGPYGSGKTQFLKQFIDEIRRDSTTAHGLILDWSSDNTPITDKSHLSRVLETLFSEGRRHIDEHQCGEIWVFVDSVPRTYLENGTVDLVDPPQGCQCVIVSELPDDYTNLSSWTYKPFALGYNSPGVYEWFYSVPMVSGIPRQRKTLILWGKRNRQLLDLYCLLILEHVDDIGPPLVTRDVFLAEWNALADRVQESPYASYLSISIVCRQILRDIEQGRVRLTEIIETLKQLRDSSPQEIARQFVRHNVARLSRTIESTQDSLRHIWTALGAMAVARSCLSTHALAEIFTQVSSEEGFDESVISQIHAKCDLLIPSPAPQWDWMWPLLREAVLKELEETPFSDLLRLLHKRFALGSYRVCADTCLFKPFDTVREAEVYAICCAAFHLMNAGELELLETMLNDPKWLVQRLALSSPSAAANDLALGRTDVGESSPLFVQIRDRLLRGARAFGKEGNEAPRVVGVLLSQLSDSPLQDSDNVPSRTEQYLHRLQEFPHRNWLRRISPFPREHSQEFRFPYSSGLEDTEITSACVVFNTFFLVVGLANGNVAATCLSPNTHLNAQSWSVGPADITPSEDRSVRAIHILTSSVDEGIHTFVMVLANGVLDFWTLATRGQAIVSFVHEAGRSMPIARETSIVCSGTVTSDKRVVLGHQNGMITVWDISAAPVCQGTYDCSSHDSSAAVLAISAVTLRESIGIIACGFWGVRCVEIPLRHTNSQEHMLAFQLTGQSLCEPRDSADDVTFASRSINWLSTEPRAVSQCVADDDRRLIFLLVEEAFLCALAVTEDGLKEVGKERFAIRDLNSGKILQLNRPQIAYLGVFRGTETQHQLAVTSRLSTGAKVWVVSCDSRLRYDARLLHAAPPVTCLASPQLSPSFTSQQPRPECPVAVLLTWKSGGIWWDYRTVEDPGAINWRVSIDSTLFVIDHNFAVLRYSGRPRYLRLPPSPELRPTDLESPDDVDNYRVVAIDLYRVPGSAYPASRVLLIARTDSVVEWWSVSAANSEPVLKGQVRTTVPLPDSIMGWAMPCSPIPLHVVLLGSSDSRTLHLYSLNDGKLLADLSVDRESRLLVKCVAVSQDGNRFAVAYSNVKSSVVRTFTTGAVYNGSQLAADFEISVDHHVISICFSSNSGRLLIAGEEGQVELVHIDSEMEIKVRSKYPLRNRIRRVLWSNSRGCFICDASEGLFTVRMNHTEDALLFGRTEQSGQPNYVSITQSSTAIETWGCVTATVGNDQLLRVWRCNQNFDFEEVAILAPSLSPVQCRITPNGSLIVVLDQLGELRFYRYKPEIFISYATRDTNQQPTENVDTQAVIDAFREQLALWGYENHIDHNDIKNADDIAKFVERIGRADRVLILMSRNYLESRWCLRELLSIYETSNRSEEELRKRVVVVNLDDVPFTRLEDRNRIVETWRQRLEDELRTSTGRQDREVSEKLLEAVTKGHLATILGLFSNWKLLIGIKGLRKKCEIFPEKFGAVREVLLKKDGEIPG
ncbi:MAG: TIR domain-containing protein [Planctomycetaceae bacterium]